MQLTGKVAIVTGAARGLGAAYALRLAKLGADIAIFDLDLEGAAKYGEYQDTGSVGNSIEALGRKCLSVRADLTNQDEVNAAVARVHATFGRIDILVNNAGGAITPMERSTPSTFSKEDLQVILNANLLSTIYCCQAVVPLMKERQAGVIITTSSMGGRIVPPGAVLAHYCVAKAAVTQYTRNLAAEVGPFGIRANCIAPGFILTGRIKALAKDRGIGTSADAERIPLRRLGEPEDCAAVIEFLATDLSSYVTGQCISVCGGAALVPA